MLTEAEKREIEELKKDKDVKRALSFYAAKTRKTVQKDRKKLYQYRWLKRKGQALAQEKAGG